MACFTPSEANKPNTRSPAIHRYWFTENSG